MKKLLSVFLCLVLLTSSVVCFAKEKYSVSSIEDAYSEFKGKHPEFVESFIKSGVSEELLMSFLFDIHDYILEINSHTPITKENFEKHALTAISTVSSREKYYPIQDTLIILYPQAIKQALKDGTVHKDLQPVVDTVKEIVFENDLINSGSGAGAGSSFGENTSTPQSPAITFSDLPSSHWAYDSVNVLTENFILNGYLDGTFKPDANITRGEFAKIIVSATDTLDTSATSSFSDVSSNDWYYYYVSSAYKEGFITGYPDGTFRPNDYITRADICTIVSRALGSPTNLSGAAFDDDMLIPSYAKIPVYALVKLEIINGMGNGKFAPTANATRAQTAKIICKAFFVYSKLQILILTSPENISSILPSSFFTLSE